MVLKSGSTRVVHAALVVIMAGASARAAPVSYAVRSDHPENLGAAVLVGETSFDRPVTVAISMPLRDAAAAAEYARRVSSPTDPLKGKFLSPVEFGRRFGVSAGDYAAVASWLRERGLAVGEEFASRTVLTARGTIAQIASAFGVRFLDYRGPDGRVFYSADRDPKMPASIALHVSAILGMSNRAQGAPAVRPKPSQDRPRTSSGAGPLGAYAPADLRTMYEMPGEAVGARRQTIALFEQSGFVPSDVSTYEARFKLPALPVRPRLLNGFGGGVTGPSAELEAVLDIDLAQAMNPALGGVIVYEDGADAFPVALLTALSAMADDNAAQVISISSTADEALQGTAAIRAENQVFVQLAAQGQTVVAASGDEGAYGQESATRNVQDPASQPFVTGVGGTTVFTGSGGTYLGEETWNDLSQAAGASGGGASAVWPIPSYQTVRGSSVASANGGSATRRNVPDLAALANPLTGVAVYSALNGGWRTVGGTSVATDLWAGYLSLLSAAYEVLGAGRVGFLNPSIYMLAYNELPLNDLHDIQDGSNGNAGEYDLPGYNAGYLYDDATGYGSPHGGTLLLTLTFHRLLGGASPPPGPTGLQATAAPTSVKLTWRKAAKASGYEVFAYDFVTGALIPGPVTAFEDAELTGLTQDRNYQIFVLSMSPGGVGESVPVFVQTKRR